ncbi:MAG: extracellular solute-binding protein [Propionibacteriales bacterium]|nr:extracellular solute-binding protein [Propionibacteriales bacterium]
MKATRLKIAALGSLGVLALAACGSGGGESAGGPTEMNMCNFAGDLGEAIEEVSAGFEKEYNVKINWCGGTGSGTENVAKIAASSRNQIYDATLVDIQNQNLASSKGLWAKLDSDIVDTSKVYEPLKAKNDDSVPIGMITNDIYYNKKTFEEKGWAPPTSYQDLVDPKYCDEVGILDVNQSYGLYTVLGLGGLTKTDAEAGNLDAAWESGLKKLSDAKECFPTLEVSSGGLEQKMQTGQYPLGTHGSVRVLPIIEAGVPLDAVIPEEGPFLTLSFIAPVKDGPNPELAQKYCEWFLKPESQKALMEKVFFGPVTPEVEVPQDLQEFGVPTEDDIDDLVIPDVETVTEKRSDWTDEYMRAMG